MAWLLVCAEAEAGLWRGREGLGALVPGLCPSSPSLHSFLHLPPLSSSEVTLKSPTQPGNAEDRFRRTWGVFPPCNSDLLKRKPQAPKWTHLC